MKKIAFALPCYNEADNIPDLYVELTKLMRKTLSNYDYELLFVDNKSTDNSRDIIREICRKDKKVKAIFNRNNCGPDSNATHALRESSGDCSILLHTDFQEPISAIPEMVKAWEDGHKVVCMVRSGSKENKFVYFCRKVYYYAFLKMSSVKQIQHFTGFGLYDRDFIKALRLIDDPKPFFKGLAAELAPDHYDIPYIQEERKAGKSSLNFFRYYDVAMLSFTSYTTGGLRMAILTGFVISIISFALAVYYLLQKLLHWEMYDTGHAPILLCVLFFGGVQMFFLGLIGEYIININRRVMSRPVAFVEERLGFDDEGETET